jgi:hypothetical protein
MECGKHRRFRSTEKTYGGAVSGIENDAFTLWYISDRLGQITVEPRIGFARASCEQMSRPASLINSGNHGILTLLVEVRHASQTAVFLGSNLH